MADDDTPPELEWDEMVASTSFLEIARFARGNETRIYRLRVVAKGAELWRIVEVPGEKPQSILECHLNDTDEALRFFGELQRSMTAGGWIER